MSSGHRISTGVRQRVHDRSAGNFVGVSGTAVNGVWQLLKPDGVGENGVCTIRLATVPGTMGVSSESDGTPKFSMVSNSLVTIYTDGPIYVAGNGVNIDFNAYYS